jgi:chemotaxis protein MotB
MRKVLLVVGIAAVVGCGGVNKKQYSAKEAEATKYKQALQDESGKVAALQAENANLQTKVGGLEKQLADAGAAKAELEATAAKLTQESGEQAKLYEELKGMQTVKLSEPLLFKEGSSSLSPESKRSLDAMADAIAQLKDKSVIVAGYTDNTEAGGKTGNVKRWQLSTARALEVAKYLVGRGLDPATIGVAGFAEARPVAPNDTLASRAQNRRAEIALTPSSFRAGTIEVKPATIK